MAGSKNVSQISSSKQLGWNCFDIAVGIDRNELVDFALSKVGKEKYRKYLSQEIRHALFLTAIYLNQKKNIAPSLVKRRIELLHIEKALDNKCEKSQVWLQVEKLDKEYNDIKDLARTALPVAMHEDILCDMVNNYCTAYENMRPAITTCATALNIQGAVSLEDLEKLINENPTTYDAQVVAAYQTMRNSIFTPSEEVIDRYCLKPETYTAYINEYYAKRGWVAFQKAFGGEKETSMVDIAAHMLEEDIVIYEKIDGRYKEIYSTDVKGKQKRAIIYQGNNHFIAYSEIQPKTESPTTESKVESIMQSNYLIDAFVLAATNIIVNDETSFDPTHQERWLNFENKKLADWPNFIQDLKTDNKKLLKNIAAIRTQILKLISDSNDSFNYINFSLKELQKEFELFSQKKVLLLHDYFYACCPEVKQQFLNTINQKSEQTLDAWWKSSGATSFIDYLSGEGICIGPNELTILANWLGFRLEIEHYDGTEVISNELNDKSLGRTIIFVKLDKYSWLCKTTSMSYDFSVPVTMDTIEKARNLNLMGMHTGDVTPAMLDLNFIARKTYNRRITEELNERNQVILSGPDGIGKSQIVVHYILRNYSQPKTFVFWLSFNESKIPPEDLHVNEIRQYYRLAKALELHYKLVKALNLNKVDYDENNLVEKFLEYPSILDKLIILIAEELNNRKQWVLVYDDILAKKPSIKKFLASNKGDIICTSRSRNWPFTIEVEPYEEYESINYLKRALHNDNLHLTKNIERNHVDGNFQSAAKTLHKKIGGFPLALHIAASYMIEHSLTIWQFLKETETAKFYNISETISDKFFNEEILSENAKELLHHCAYLYYEGISQELLKKILFYCDDRAFTSALSELIKYSYITVEEDRLPESELQKKDDEEKQQKKSIKVSTNNSNNTGSSVSEKKYLQKIFSNNENDAPSKTKIRFSINTFVQKFILKKLSPDKKLIYFCHMLEIVTRHNEKALENLSLTEVDKIFTYLDYIHVQQATCLLKHYTEYWNSNPNYFPKLARANLVNLTYLIGKISYYKYQQHAKAKRYFKESAQILDNLFKDSQRRDWLNGVDNLLRMKLTFNINACILCIYRTRKNDLYANTNYQTDDNKQREKDIEKNRKMIDLSLKGFIDLTKSIQISDDKDFDKNVAINRYMKILGLYYQASACRDLAGIAKNTGKMLADEPKSKRDEVAIKSSEEERLRRRAEARGYYAEIISLLVDKPEKDILDMKEVISLFSDVTGINIKKSKKKKIPSSSSKATYKYPRTDKNNLKDEDTKNPENIANLKRYDKIYYIFLKSILYFQKYTCENDNSIPKDNSKHITEYIRQLNLSSNDLDNSVPEIKKNNVKLKAYLSLIKILIAERKKTEGPKSNLHSNKIKKTVKEAHLFGNKYFYESYLPKKEDLPCIVSDHDQNELSKGKLQYKMAKIISKLLFDTENRSGYHKNEKTITLDLKSKDQRFYYKIMFMSIKRAFIVFNLVHVHFYNYAYLRAKELYNEIMAKAGFQKIINGIKLQAYPPAVSNLEQQIINYTEQLQHDIHNSQARLSRAQLFILLGNFTSAISDYEYVLKSKKDDIATSLSCGHAYFHIGEYSNALIKYRYVLQYSPGDEDLKNWIKTAENLDKFTTEKPIDLLYTKRGRFIATLKTEFLTQLLLWFDISTGVETRLTHHEGWLHISAALSELIPSVNFGYPEYGIGATSNLNNAAIGVSNVFSAQATNAKISIANRIASQKDELKTTIHPLAEVIADDFSPQIEQLTYESVEILARVAAERMLQHIGSGRADPNKTVKERLRQGLFKGASYSPKHHSALKIFKTTPSIAKNHLRLEKQQFEEPDQNEEQRSSCLLVMKKLCLTSEQDTAEKSVHETHQTHSAESYNWFNKKWTAEGLFTHSGIATIDGRFFVHRKHSKHTKYGFRMGTPEEAISIDYEELQNSTKML